MTIGDVRLPAIVDTGASHSVVNRAAVSLLVEGGLFRERPDTVTIMTSAGVELGVILKIDQPKRINETDWQVDELIAADLPIFTLLGARKIPAMVLGMDLLGGKDIAIDFRGWRLFLRTHPETQSAPDLD